MLWSVIYNMCHIYPSWHRIGNVRMRARVCTHAYTIIYVHTHMILLVETICLDAVCTYKYVNVYIYICVCTCIYIILLFYTHCLNTIPNRKCIASSRPIYLHPTYTTYTCSERTKKNHSLHSVPIYWTSTTCSWTLPMSDCCWDPGVIPALKKHILKPS